jgi:phytoene desaturase
MGVERYDVVVIGSGMGGMCAAALLAHEGYRVLVTERLPYIGGRCSTIEYRGFKCTTGVIGPETGGVIQGIFDKVGADFNVRPVGPPHYLVGGKIHEVPAKGGFRTLLAAATRDETEIERVMEAISRALSWMEPSASISLRQWLLQYTRNEAILAIFQAMVSATTFVNADELPAREYFLFLKKMRGYRGFGYCPEGSVALPRSLSRVVEKNGGSVWTSCPAVRILSEKGVVRGAVVRRGGEEIQVQAAVVISNCGPRRTVELAGRENMDKGYLKELDETVKPAMVIVIQFASDTALLDCDYLIVTGLKRINAVFQPTSICPELAPPGRHLLVAGGAPVSSLSPLDGRKEIELCLAELREILPGFDRHAQLLLTGTFQGEWPAMQSWPGSDMPQKTPIVNLYNVGDGVKSSGMMALAAAAETGALVAEDVMRRVPARGRDH